MNYANTKYYFNRELSWLEFNERVLEEAFDSTNPLMERLKFLAITASNLDEFFMVRVSAIWEQESAGVGSDPSGMTPMEQLGALSHRAHQMSDDQYDCYDKLVPLLKRAGISFLEFDELNENQIISVRDYYYKTLYPVITPMGIDKNRPFPVLNNRTVNLLMEVKGDDETPYFAIAQVPTVLPRLYKLNSPKGTHSYIMLENIMLAYIDTLFPGHTVLRTSMFRVTRNSDLEFDSDEIGDMIQEMERSIKRRRWGDPVRIEITQGIGDDSLEFLVRELKLVADEIYYVSGPLDLNAFMGMTSMPEFIKLQKKPMPPKAVPAFLECKTMFDVIREQDVVVHHPYMSFDSVLRFVEEAANDPDVLAIKQTLYRVSGNSPIVNSLMKAAENGKQVTVLVELFARFDEENNIIWAKRMEQSGCHVVYGQAGLKTHCKICLVVRREDDGIRRYMHLGTGNYNDATAKIYVDTGYFTCKESFGQDCSILFNSLTGYAKNAKWQKFAVAPLTIRAAFIRLIETETANAQAGRSSRILAKLNSLSDVGIIQALYCASNAGVQIRLLVRGICCLKAGIKGVSENIEVSSIVDRFLEHDRIYIFENGGSCRVFLSSADWMVRNLDRRVEIMFPIEDAGLKNDIIAYLELSLSDNVKRRLQQADGSYKKPENKGKAKIRSQYDFYGLVSKTMMCAKGAALGHL